MYVPDLLMTAVVENEEVVGTHEYAPELLVLGDVEAALLGQDLYVLHVVVVPVGH